MCGIVGGFGLRCKKRDILAGHQVLSHRGQDEAIFASCGPSGFWGMNRLSIQDSQPGLYPFHYKHFSLIFNGEIYNLMELQKLLRSKGVRCKTNCDAEVILPLFELYGVKAFQKIDGMFAIAIFDEQKNCFYLARDVFGEKPLYYTQFDQSIFFASELPALPQFTKHISEAAIPEFLTFGFLNQRRTFFENVWKVMPGECVTLDTARVQTKQFDQLSTYLTSDLAILEIPDLTAELSSRLEKVVQKKLVGESPIGIFLSGGLDSSLLTAITQKQNTQRIFTYSLGFADSQHDESAVALEVAKRFQTNHTQLHFADKDVKHIWQSISKTGDEPISDPALLPTFLLAQRAKTDVKVILTGEGADEIFGGYKRYQRLSLSHYLTQPHFAEFLERFPATKWSLYKLFAPLKNSYSPVTYTTLWQSGLASRTKYLKELQHIWQETGGSEPAFTQLPIPQNLQLHDLQHYVAEQLCMKTDKMLMQHTIESRAPYLDKSLLPFLAVANQADKKLLRKVAEQYLPDSIVNKPKHGFSLPLAHILRDVLRSEVEQLFTAHPMMYSSITQANLDSLVISFLAGNDHLKNEVWNVLTLNTWLSTQH